MTTLPKVTTVNKTNLQPGELINTDLTLYNVTSNCGFTSIITVFSEKNRIIWVLPTASKQAPVHIIRSSKKLRNEQHP